MSADRIARAALSATVEPGLASIMRRVELAGAEATWRAIQSGDDSLDVNRTLRRRARHVDGAETLAEAARLGIGYVCPGEPGWPDCLDVLTSTIDAGDDAVPPPFGLWVRGEIALDEAVARAVAVVGSRNATAYGERVGADMGADLAIAGWTVVSGAAFGIDAAAHRGALAMGGTTVAVLAGGVDVSYPKSHAGLLERITTQGVVVSEAPPGTRPMRSRFLSRNRLIAGLSAGTVVVEAALRSGALSTATWTGKLSREVLAVPGPVTSALSAGCHNLVREKAATMVTEVRDVLDAVGSFGADAAPLRRGRDRPIDALAPIPRLVREAMPGDRVCSVDQLAEATGLLPGAVQVALLELATGGWVVQGVEGWELGTTSHSGRT